VFGCDQSIRILHVHALLAARVPLILKVNVMEVPSILQEDSVRFNQQTQMIGAPSTVDPIALKAPRIH
jgi:hypothetical protein